MADGSRLPVFRLDRVLVDDEVRPTYFRVVDSPEVRIASDHLQVIATVDVLQVPPKLPVQDLNI